MEATLLKKWGMDTKELRLFMGKKATEGNITSDVIRQIFIIFVKEYVSLLEACTLGKICCVGEGFNTGEYRDAVLVTDGTNAWSAVFLSTSDNGMTLLQKIATATILKYIIQAIQEIETPAELASKNLMPIEILSGDQIDELEKRKGDVSRILGW
jgi:hypothetical protein